MVTSQRLANTISTPLACRICLGMIVCLLFSGCGAGSVQYPFQMPGYVSTDADVILWPSPPAVPRYAFIGHLYGESNSVPTNQDRSTWSGILAAVTGSDAENVTLVNLAQPQQIASDNNGRIYVADTGRQAIFVFDEVAGEFFIWNETSLNIPFLSPVGVINAANSIWVTDSELSLVYRLSDNGELIDTVGKGVVNRPTGITYDPDADRIFVSDTADDNIKVFSTNGELIDIWGAAGAKNGELNSPTYIAYRQGKLYIGASLNARIQIFDDTGQYLQTLGQRGLYVGNLSRPKGVALDSDGNIYVAESYYDHVIIYDKDGNLLMSLGGSGFDAGQFSQPTGLWVDSHDRVFVSDMLNRRISMFQYLGGN